MRYIYLILIILLAACAPMPSQTPVPLGVQAVNATQAARATGAAFEAQEARATQAALYTAQAIGADNAALAATSSAYGQRSTQTAQVYRLEGQRLGLTQTAFAIQSAHSNGTATQAAQAATVTAIHNEIINTSESGRLMAVVFPVLVFLFGVALIWTVYRFFCIAQDIRVRQNSIVETSLGPVLIDGQPGGELSVMFLDWPTEEHPELTAGPQPGDNVKMGGLYHTQDVRRVGRFLDDVCTVSGPMAVGFPSYRNLMQPDGRSWSSGQWQKATDWLVSRDAIIKLPRKQTVVNAERYPNIGALRAAFINGELSNE